MPHLTRVKSRLALRTHRPVRGVLDGEYASLHTGRSLDFNDLREYVRGDDVKDIDWKASARSRSLLVKRYVAIRQHQITLVVSTGRSMAAGNTRTRSKREAAVLVAGLVGWLALRHGDQVTVVHGDSAEQHIRRPATTEVALEHGLAAIHDATVPGAAPSDLAGLLRFVTRVVRRRSILLVVTDDPATDQVEPAGDEPLDPALESALRRLVVQHEVLLVTVGDLDPTTASADTLVDVDTATAVPEWLRGDAQLRAEYADLVARRRAQWRSTLERLGIAHEQVGDEDSAVPAVFRLLERHRHAHVR
ncbi:DUF58 domain-containing protein [Nocardioides insulae]|uniref:DUF58 domain-containing protein n=1 Tax=Nocardioides insulae TaxID=394734 RepID=UPI0003F8A558|nr:DUF58 domain-containing protein [Nocardioides insulae]